MGFEEEVGVIPKFCHELFSKLASIKSEEVSSLFVFLHFYSNFIFIWKIIKWSVLVPFESQVKCHVEMSYFEVYNEKIHDLLVTREEPNQRTMPVSSLLLSDTHPWHMFLSLTCHCGWLTTGEKCRKPLFGFVFQLRVREHPVHGPYVAELSA